VRLMAMAMAAMTVHRCGTVPVGARSPYCREVLLLDFGARRPAGSLIFSSPGVEHVAHSREEDRCRAGLSL